MAGSLINRAKLIIKRGALGLGLIILISAPLGVFFLKQGIRVNHLTIKNIELSGCDLIWNDKLELKIDSVSIPKSDRTSPSTTNISAFRKSLYASHKFARLFSFVAIADLSVGGQSIEVKLIQNNNREYILTLLTEHINFKSGLTLGKDSFVADIYRFDSRRFNSSATGQIRLEAENDQVKGELSALFNESFPVTVNFVSDEEQISFVGTEAGPIHEIEPLVDLFGLSHNIQRWITDYLKGSRYNLKYFKGHFPWDEPGVLLDTLEAEVRVNDTEYTFAQGLEPIKGKYTDLFFSKGVLAIKPHESTFYGQDGGTSWLDINFNDPANIILTAYIITNAVANDDILTLLNHYRISLPFKQVGGTTDTDLTLTINLNKLKIGAEATFAIEKGLVSYDGLIFNVSDAKISLVNADVTLDQLTVGYRDLFAAEIGGTFLVNAGMADLDITLTQINFDIKDSPLRLDETAANPQISYHFDNRGHVMETGPTSWTLGPTKLKLGAFRAPLFLDDFSIKLPPVQLDIIPGIQAKISGSLSIKGKKADIGCALEKYHINDLELLGSPVSVAIDYDQGWVFRTSKTAHLSLSGIPVSLYPSELTLDDQSFRVLESRITYGSFFDSRVVGHFNREMSEGIFYLKKIDVPNVRLDENLDIGDEVLVEISTAGGNFVAKCPEFDLWFRSEEDKNWSAFLGDFSKIYSRSRLLQQYGIKEGSLTISSANGSLPYIFSADIASPYRLLIDSDGPIGELNISGEIKEGGVTATVNENLHLDFADNILAIRSNDLAFNIPALIELIQSLPPAAEDNEDAKTGPLFFLEAENSHLYLNPKSKILADRIELEYLNETINMHLNHGPGRILLKLEGDHFLADGEGLNDVFMGALIQDAFFQGGQMSIAASGDFNEFSALLQIEDSVLTEFKTVNNVMAFLNTVPSLMTFSLPDYNSTGLLLESAMVGMRFKDRYATFESMELVSPELRGVGIGWIDFSGKVMDLDVNLTTQKKVNIRKIPVAGYILEGKKGESSMTMKIKGDLDDPEVSYSLFKEIAQKPTKVLWRVLKLPVDMYREASEEAGNKDQSGSTMDKPIESGIGEKAGGIAH